MKAKAKADKKIIVLPESYEIRNLEAAAECLRDELAEIVLIGNKEKIMERYGCRLQFAERDDLSEGAVVIEEGNRRALKIT